ncbi:MAG: hypothetical protein ACI9U2_002262 [Bradymonadia bacterium]|jgi:hypothetical protein
MSIRLTGGDPACRSMLGARLDRLGVHDWVAATQPNTTQIQVSTAAPGPPEDLDNYADLTDAELLRRLDAIPRAALICGHSVYLKRLLHGVYNAMTPALISVSMTRDVLGRTSIQSTDLVDHLDEVVGALETAQTRIEAIAQLANARPISVDVRAVLEFFDRPDSVLHGVTPSGLRFEIEPAPLARIQPGCLDGWLLTLAATLGRSAYATLVFSLTSKTVDGEPRACLRVAVDRDPMTALRAPAIASLHRAAIAQGAQFQLTTHGVEIVLSPVRSAPLANGHRALVAVADPWLRARLNAALLAGGYLTSEVALPQAARAQIERYGCPAVIVLDSRASTGLGAEAPAHIVAADLEAAPGRRVPLRTTWISAFASPACVQQAAARHAAHT